MGLLKQFMTLLISLIANQSYAKTLLVSDIDDTLKVSHIKSFTDSIASAFKTGPAFRGMADLYTLLSENADITIVYVTNAPKSIMQKSHTQFIAVNAFPKGDIHFFNGGSKDDNKFNIISGLLKDSMYDSVILIGDNGEKDPVAYQRVKEAFPFIHFETFIHTPYEDGTALNEDDLGYMNPAIISQKLCRKGFMDVSKELQFRKQMNYEITQNIEVENQVFTTDWSTTVTPVGDENPCFFSLFDIFDHLKTN